MIDIRYSDDINLSQLHAKICLEIDDKDLVLEFIQKVSDLLVVYEYLKPKTDIHKPMIYGKKVQKSIPSTTNVDKINIHRRMIVIARYLRIANRYCEISVIHIPSSNNLDICAECGSILVKEGDYSICKSCGIVEYDTESSEFKSYSGNASYYNDIDIKDDSMLHAILVLQGKQTKIPPKESIDKIIAYCKQKNIPIEKLSIFSLHNIMQSINLKEFYVSINYIYSKIMCISPPNISAHEDMLLKKYRKMYEFAGNILRSNKNSSPRDILLLQSMLQMEGIKVDKKYFTEIRTPSVRESYNGTLKDACSKLKSLFPDEKWDFIPL